MGGGSRNALWNQIKANRLGIPIKVLDDAETTVAGAAMFGWYGVGEFFRQNRPERRSRTATAISGRKLNLN